MIIIIIIIVIIIITIITIINVPAGVPEGPSYFLQRMICTLRA